MVPAEIPGQYFTVLGDRASLQDITIQRCILIHLDLVHMLILVSKTVFISVYTPLVAIRFSASAQLVSSDLLSCHSGGAAEEAAGGRAERVLRERANVISKISAAADSNTIFVSQGAEGP